MAQAPAAVVVRRWTARIKRTALGRDVTPSPVGLDADDWNGRRGSWFVKRRRRCVQRGRWWSVVVNGARSVYVVSRRCHLPSPTIIFRRRHLSAASDIQI